jgi:hypothetical protein
MKRGLLHPIDIWSSYNINLILKRGPFTMNFIQETSSALRAILDNAQLARLVALPIDLFPEPEPKAMLIAGLALICVVILRGTSPRP